MDIISTFNSSFTINRLTEAQYQAAKDAGEISGYNEFEFYMTEGDSGGGGGDYVLSAATSTALGGIKIGHANDDTTLGVKLDSNNKAYVDKVGGFSYVLSAATDTTLGGIKVGMTDTDSKLGVKLDSTTKQAYVTNSVASNTTLGNIKIGHANDDTTLGVKLDSNNKAYVDKSVASSSDLGGIKIGFTKDTTNSKYPVELQTSTNKAYVEIPKISDSLSSEQWEFTLSGGGTYTAKVAIWKN